MVVYNHWTGMVECNSGSKLFYRVKVILMQVCNYSPEGSELHKLTSL